jgi:hypothetical protein
MMFLKKEGKLFLIYLHKCTRIKYMKNYNLKVNMRSKLCMLEHFDLLITYPFKFKCETLSYYVCCNIY